MAKREISSTLRNLKFMQRAAVREEQTKKEEEVKPDGNFLPPGTLNRKCVVIMEGDPHPGTTKGRMSFQSFNPSIDKLNEEAASLRQSATSATSSGNQSGKMSSREDDEAGCSNTDSQNSEANGDLKRKKSKVSETPSPYKSEKTVQGNQDTSSNNGKRSFKKPKSEKLDWNVLRPSKSSNKK